MGDKLESLIKTVYKNWKAGRPKAEGPHLDEELLACLIEDKLSLQGAEEAKKHLISCSSCAENFALTLKIKAEELIVPQGLLERLTKDVKQETPADILEIALKLKDKLLEIINTTGDVLVGYEVVPAPALRSRNIKDFKDEISILKDFANIRVEAKIENKMGKAFSLTITVKERATSRVLKDLRIALIKDDTELESYILDAGSVTFENVAIGSYNVKISNLDGNLARVQLEIRR